MPLTTLKLVDSYWWGEYMYVCVYIYVYRFIYCLLDLTCLVKQSVHELTRPKVGRKGVLTSKSA